MESESPVITSLKTAPLTTINALPTSTLSSTNKTLSQRHSYELPLTEAQQQSINDDQAPLPIVKDNPNFNNKINGICGNKECTLAVERWWSNLKASQLVTVRDFKEKVSVIKNCTKCNNPKKTPIILQSMSKYLPMKVRIAKYNNQPVDLFEINEKE
jgi:hypothetical protein